MAAFEGRAWVRRALWLFAAVWLGALSLVYVTLSRSVLRSDPLTTQGSASVYIPYPADKSTDPRPPSGSHPQTPFGSSPLPVLKQYEALEPREEYEQSRRRLKQILAEHHLLVSTQLKEMLQKNATESAAADIAHFSRLSNEHHRALMSKLEELQRSDGYEAWRAREAAELSSLVQRRLHHLQNPKNCSTARKVTCPFNIYGCGFGCQIHRSVMCLTVAYLTKRTLIYESNKWIYHKDGWEAVYLNLSNTCLDSKGTSVGPWPGKTNPQVVKLSTVPMVLPPPGLPPLTVPADLAPRLQRIHGHPYVWWVGQMLKYLLRPQEKIAKMLEEYGKKIGFKKPIVGVHIRRGDKKKEAKYYQVEEYMDAVEEYYNVLELTQNVSVRRIYLATDAPKVVTEMKEKYPHYEILGDLNGAKAASRGYNENALLAIMKDIHFLSKSDFLVCTFSSNFGRLVYEIMQAYHPDATDKVRSLDLMYVFYTRREPNHQIVVYPHSAQKTGEIDLKVGDIIYVIKNRWNGYSYGTNLRSNEVGVYPSFKAEHKVATAESPSYSEVSWT